MSGLAIAARALEQQRELQAERIHALEASAATPTLVEHLREQLAAVDREIRALRSAVDGERDEELPLSAHGPALEQVRLSASVPPMSAAPPPPTPTAPPLTTSLLLLPRPGASSKPPSPASS